MSVGAGFEAVQATIVAGTYPGVAEEVVGLYGHILSTIQRCEMPVDFGRRALDVGSRDERYRSLIMALGPTEVIGIEPDIRETARATRWGIAEEGDIFGDDLQSWADADPAPADSVFLFNVLRRLVESRDFMEALKKSVAIGGIAVVSFMRSDADTDFISSLPQLFTGFRRIGTRPPDDSVGGGMIPRQVQVRNTNLSIWQRED